MKLSKITLLLLAVIMILGFGGCKESHGQRKESTKDYVNTVKNHMEEKYSTTFEVVEFDVYDSAFHGMETNTVVLRDVNGVLTNIRAGYTSPYNFYDDYVDACTAAKILDQLEYDDHYIESMALSVNVRVESIENIDISADNVKHSVLIAKIPHRPKDANLKAIYEVYKAMEAMGYKDMHFLIGFIKGSSDFDAVIENYKFHGKVDNSPYTGKVYAILRTHDRWLSFEEFKLCLEEN